MIICSSMKEIRDFTSTFKKKKIGLVPTMGFLHEGHLQLVDIAKKNADIVVVSIFVNPTQFGPNEDFDRYPQDFDGDRNKLEQRGVDAVFYPNKESMYPLPFRSYINVEEISNIYCGASRPGHFRGVATIVAKLFNIVQPQIAVFGEKDFQQLTIIRQMVKDLNFPVRIIVGPIVREKDGLAMSSRNKYLSPEERKESIIISASYAVVKELYTTGIRDIQQLKTAAQKKISEAKNAKIDYIEFVDGNTLKAQDIADKKTRILFAVYFGKTRLIDNFPLL